MYDDRIRRALDRFPAEISDELPASLPLLDEFRRTRRPNPKRLADVDVLFVQHHLGPLIRRLDAMFEDGLRPERTWVVDIPYSTHEPIRDLIHERFGVPWWHFATPLRDPLAPYAAMQLRRVEEIVYHMAHGLSGSRVLVVDDGAYFVRALKHIEDLDEGFARAFAGRTHIVEQTTRGHRYLVEPEHAEYRRLVEEVLEAPVVSVAKSATKIEFESPFIGAAAARALRKVFERETIDIARLRRVALIGFGAVGEAVFRAVKDMGTTATIRVVETDATKHERIRRLGGDPMKKLPGDGGLELVIGCTGYTSFALPDWRLLADKACLVSTSSAAVEFNRKQFIDLADLYEHDEFMIDKPEATRRQGIHATIRILDTRREREVSFINASFPVNFDGKMECLPAEMIQATHALLYAAGCQVLETRKPGLEPLRHEEDEELKAKAPSFLAV